MRRLLACSLLLLVPLAFAACGGQEEEGAAEDRVPAGTAAVERAEEELAWQRYAEGVDLARSENKVVLVDFWTTWCHWCKVMDKDTYADESVQRRLVESFVVIKVNAESDEAQGPEGSPSGRDIARDFQVSSYPTTWFVDAEGQKIAPLPGFMPPAQFVVVLDYISTGAYKTQDFKDFQAGQDVKAEG